MGGYKAMRVGGRRLSHNSNTTRPRLRTISSASEPIEPGVTTHEPPADYPRPNAPQAAAENLRHEHEEDIPKREKRQGHNNIEKELEIWESAQRKVETNRPSKNSSCGGRDSARGDRIAQPAGKAMAF
ncbi:hypothetical protein NEOLEDRAFT_105567 [Neolentinus lepideus HHB14362 ss-1]|uniref:Uncharacterized protein n=1 Tax=Neolentinus lepideus HHB14362 ss-1 TaxID=1314782 RepID=A0A165U4E8_9AGAM|nr:hypothetical protein NEOLEDRAFT_105567 [Neolentinus lepideus HHB14362 ss-1]